MMNNDSISRNRPFWKLFEPAVSQDTKIIDIELTPPGEIALSSAPQKGIFSIKVTKQSYGFTLFEVLIALAVFALAVTGLAIALESIVQTALETRQRTLSHMELESRLAYNMVDPPIQGERTLSAAENHGFEVIESATPEEIEDGEGHPLQAIYRLKIISKMGNATHSLETLIYHP